MAFSNVQKRPVRSAPSKTNVRTVAAAYPAGRGVNQPSGNIKIKHRNPPKTKAVARPNS